MTDNKTAALTAIIALYNEGKLSQEQMKSAVDIVNSANPAALSADEATFALNDSGLLGERIITIVRMSYEGRAGSYHNWTGKFIQDGEAQFLHMQFGRTGKLNSIRFLGK